MATLRNLLLDSGPAVALLNVRDPDHNWAIEFITGFSGQLHTTSAVITEAMHFAGATRKGPGLVCEFVAASRMLVHDYAQAAELRDAVALMDKYADTPMDYADATLVLLAEKLGVYDILTLDWRGFTVFRTRDGRSFNIVSST